MNRVAWGVVIASVALGACHDVMPPTPVDRPPSHLAVAMTCDAERSRISCHAGSPVVARSAEVAARVALTAPEVAQTPPGGEASVVVFGGSTGRVRWDLFLRVLGAGFRVTFGTTIENRMGQPMGTLDGVNADSDGIRIGLVGGPTTTAGSGTVTPVGTNGTATFTATNQPFWTATNWIVRPGVTVTSDVTFDVPTTVQRFRFRLLLSTSLLDETEAGLRPTSEDFVELAVSDFGGCGIRADGSLWCWGRDDEGQLAANTYDRDILGVGGGNWIGTSLALGDSHLCLTNNSTNFLSCIGSSSEGQGSLGFSFAYFENLTRLDPAPTLQRLSAGGSNTCGFTMTDVAVCWGDARFGQLTTAVPLGTTALGTPTAVALPNGVTYAHLFVGRAGHICALSTDARAYCWGRNDAGQIGNGIVGGANASPTLVSGGRFWRHLALGDRHTCGVDRDNGEVLCWGAGEYRQSGVLAAATPVPTAVNGVPGAALVAAGADFSCAAGANGAWCWGRNDYGQAGNTTTTRTASPGLVATGAGAATQLTAGDRHACAYFPASLQLFCWGDNRQGQLSLLPETGFRSTPYYVNDLQAGDTLLPAGRATTCVGRPGGPSNTYLCLGSNVGRQLGGFGDPPQRRPVGILGGQRWREVGVGDGHACAINLNSVVYCWGRGYAGQLGDGTSDGRPRPAAIATTGDSTFFGLSVGDDHACAIRARDGQLFCWGRNTNGQVGNGTTSSVTSPVAITGLVNLSRVVAGPRHTCASGPDTFWCWGANAAGQLGLGDQSDRTTPQVVVSQGGIPTSFALGGDEDPEHGFTCAVTEGPGVSCAGANGRGQLATGAISAPSLTFIPAVALPIGEVYTAVTAGAAHACAGAFTGTWYCWGANDLRQASFDDATFTILGPDPVSGATVGVPARLRNARDASCALVQGSWRCFGRRNRVGEMGSGVIGRTEVLESIR